MSIEGVLDAIEATVNNARAVPMSASCMVNRAEMIGLIERARTVLPEELDEADAVLKSRDDLITWAQEEARVIVERAKLTAADQVEVQRVTARAHLRAQQILDAAASEAARLLREADAYCDQRLALLQAELDKVTAQVTGGRERLRQRSHESPASVAEAITGEPATVESLERETADEHPADVVAGPEVSVPDEVVAEAVVAETEAPDVTDAAEPELQAETGEPEPQAETGEAEPAEPAEPEESEAPAQPEPAAQQPPKLVIDVAGLERELEADLERDYARSELNDRIGVGPQGQRGRFEGAELGERG